MERLSFVVITVIGAIVLQAEFSSSDWRSWPNVKCHSFLDAKQYKNFPESCFEWAPHRRKVYHCRVEKFKGCMISTLGIISCNDKDKKNIKLEYFDQNPDGMQNLKETLSNIFPVNKTEGLTTEQTNEGNVVVNRMFTSLNGCKAQFTDVVEKKKLRDDQWDPLYKCVEKAFECKK